MCQVDIKQKKASSPPVKTNSTSHWFQEGRTYNTVWTDTMLGSPWQPFYTREPTSFKYYLRFIVYTKKTVRQVL